MLLWTIFKVSFKSLLANKLRSFLAMLGIIIGVGAVISMLALGAGAKKQVMSRITSMGTNLLIVRSGADVRGGVRSESSDKLKLDDASAILDEVQNIEMLSPVVMGRAQVKHDNENTSTSIVGVSLTYFDIRNFEIEKGRGFSSIEEDRSARVAVIGSNTAELLFGKNECVGESIRIKNVNFRVIGLLKSKGDQGWFNPDDMVVVPIITAMQQLFGQEFINEIDIKAKEGMLGDIEEKTTQLLRKRHRIREDSENDFHIRNQAEIIDMASSFTKTFTILLGGIASISLLVGGIGIMNIMLVTVTERTREIGVRKAIGARDKDILRQFLLESIFISGIGGLFGILFGFGISKIVSSVSEYKAIVETQSIVLAIAVSASVGIFFGYYPARRAARLDPIEALRYE